MISPNAKSPPKPTFEEYQRERDEKIRIAFQGFPPGKVTGKEYDSPSGKYTLVVSTESQRKEGWKYSRGVVKNKVTQEVTADIRRNYENFWHCWIQRDKQEYLLCGEDYQGYTIINATSGKRQSYLPPEAIEGFGFCFASVETAPDQNYLLVDGCYWAGPYELRIYDFRNPEVLPYPLLKRITLEESFETSQEWVVEDGKMIFRYSIDLAKPNKSRLQTADLHFIQEEMTKEIKEKKEKMMEWYKEVENRWSLLPEEEKKVWEEKTNQENQESLEEAIEDLKERLKSDKEITSYNWSNEGKMVEITYRV